MYKYYIKVKNCEMPIEKTTTPSAVFFWLVINYHLKLSDYISLIPINVQVVTSDIDEIKKLINNNNDIYGLLSKCEKMILYPNIKIILTTDELKKINLINLRIDDPCSRIYFNNVFDLKSFYRFYKFLNEYFPISSNFYLKNLLHH